MASTCWAAPNKSENMSRWTSQPPAARSASVSLTSGEMVAAARRCHGLSESLLAEFRKALKHFALVRAAARRTMRKEAGCPVGLSVYALPKTGSSFLGRFLKSLSVHLHVCMVLELKAECGTLVRVGCPPEWGGRRSAPLSACVPKSEGCSWGWLMSNTQPLEAHCCSAGADRSLPSEHLGWQPGNDSGYTECSRTKTASLLVRKRLPGASGTL
eukprot:4778395-Prymnesium_polylepis.1